jgi:hypothetical protein
MDEKEAELLASGSARSKSARDRRMLEDFRNMVSGFGERSRFLTGAGIEIIKIS